MKDVEEQEKEFLSGIDDERYMIQQRYEKLRRKQLLEAKREEEANKIGLNRLKQRMNCRDDLQLNSQQAAKLKRSARKIRSKSKQKGGSARNLNDQ